jgi:hypothetical protein
MPNTVTSPNMGIVVPVVLTQVGPTWATNVYNALFATIDAHDHSAGKGVQITPPGLNINADLAFGSFNATALRTSRYTSQGAPLALGTDIGCLYNVLGDAYWNNAAGTAIRLTKNGAVNLTIASWSTRLISGSYTVLASDPYVLFLVNLSGGVGTVNLPASNTLAAGQQYIFEDYRGSSDTNALTIVPNGTDTINGVNAGYIFQQNFGQLLLVTDAAGRWTATWSAEPYVRTNGLNFLASAATPSITQAQSTTGAGVTLLVQSQAAKTGSAAAGGNIVVQSGAGDGAGAPGTIQTKLGPNLGQQFAPWQGTFDVNQGVVIDIPFILKTTDTSTHAAASFTMPNNTSAVVQVLYSAKQTGTPANAAGGAAVSLVINNGGALSANAASSNLTSLGASPQTAAAISTSGTAVVFNVTASTASAVDWQGVMRVILN